MAGIDKMKGYAIAVMVLAAVDLTALAVVAGFKDTGLVDNTTADKFITGIGIFAAFTSVIVLALVGKIIVGIFSKE